MYIYTHIIIDYALPLLPLTGATNYDYNAMANKRPPCDPTYSQSFEQ